MFNLSGKKSLHLLIFIVLSFTAVKIAAQSAGQSIAPNTFSITEKKKNIRQSENQEQRKAKLQIIELYKKEILSSPDNAVIYNNLGATYAEVESYQEAIAAMQKAIEINPAIPNFHYNLGVIYERSNRLPEALEQVRKAISMDGLNPNFQMQLCQVLLTMENFKEAVPCHEKLFQMEKPDVSMRTNYGIALIWTEQIDKAFGVLEQNVELYPNEAITHNALGMALFQKKKYKQAIESFSCAVELDNKLDAARYNLALAQLAVKDRGSAIRQYAFLKNSNSDFAGLLFKFLFNGSVVEINK